MGLLINQEAPDFEADTTAGRIKFHNRIGDSWAVLFSDPWKQGDDVVIAGSVSNDEAKEIFGEWKSPKPYIRIVPQPR
jgi:hypothetical protein